MKGAKYDTFTAADALPVGSVVQDTNGSVFERQEDGNYYDGPHDWKSPDGLYWDLIHMAFPLTCLWVPIPGEPPWEPPVPLKDEQVTIEAWVTFAIIAAAAVLLTVFIGCVAIMVVKFVADTLAPETDTGKGFLYRSVHKADQMETEVARLEDELAQAKVRLAELRRATRKR